MNNVESSFIELTGLVDKICGDFYSVKVAAVYVHKDMMDWLLNLESSESWAWERGGIQVHKTKTGSEVVTMRPYGMGDKIPVKGKYSGHGPWKIVLGPKKFDGGEA